MKSYEIVGYTYQAEIWTPADLIEDMIATGELSPGARGMSSESVLDMYAEIRMIDRYDERSYDSDQFPKVIFSSDVETREDYRYLLGYTEEEIDALEIEEY